MYIIGKKYTILLKLRNDSVRLNNNIGSVFSNGTPLNNVQIIFKNKKNQEILSSTDFHPITDDKKNIIAFLIHITDIMNLVKIRKDLANLSDLAESWWIVKKGS